MAFWNFIGHKKVFAAVSVGIDWRNLPVSRLQIEEYEPYVSPFGKFCFTTKILPMHDGPMHIHLQAMIRLLAVRVGQKRGAWGRKMDSEKQNYGWSFWGEMHNTMEQFATHKLNWNYVLHIPKWLLLKSVFCLYVNIPSLQILYILSDNAFRPVHPSILWKWIKLKFRIENTVKANKKFTVTNNKQHQARGVSGNHESQQIIWYLLWLCQLLYPLDRQHWEQWCFSRSDDVAETQAQQYHMNNFYINYHMPNKKVHKTPSVTEEQEISSVTVILQRCKKLSFPAKILLCIIPSNNVHAVAGGCYFWQKSWFWYC